MPVLAVSQGDGQTFHAQRVRRCQRQQNGQRIINASENCGAAAPRNSQEKKSREKLGHEMFDPFRSKDFDPR